MMEQFPAPSSGKSREELSERMGEVVGLLADPAGMSPEARKLLELELGLIKEEMAALPETPESAVANDEDPFSKAVEANEGGAVLKRIDDYRDRKAA